MLHCRVIGSHPGSSMSDKELRPVPGRATGRIRPPAERRTGSGVELLPDLRCGTRTVSPWIGWSSKRVFIGTVTNQQAPQAIGRVVPRRLGLTSACARWRRRPRVLSCDA
jgi:hypothetical protein